MLWYKITFQVQSFWLLSAMLPVRSQSNRRMVFSPSMQIASEPLAVNSASFTVMSAVL